MTNAATTAQPDTCTTCTLDAKRASGQKLTDREIARWSMVGCECDLLAAAGDDLRERNARRVSA